MIYITDYIDFPDLESSVVGQHLCSFSDKKIDYEKITVLLGEEEYHIARRTVSKYREELGIETSKYRREL